MPALAVAVPALLALLLALASIYLVKLLVQLMPADLPVIGNRLRNAVNDVGTAAAAAIMHLLDAAIAPLARVIAYPVDMFKRVIAGITATLAELAALSAYIHHWAMPYLLNQAKKFATGIVAHARAALQNAINAAVAYARTLARAAETYAAHIVAALSHAIYAALAKTYATLRTAITASVHYTQFLVGHAEALAAGALASAVTHLSGAIAAVDHFARAAYADTLGRLITLTVQLEHYARDAAAAAVTESTAIAAAGIHAGLVDVWPAITSEVATLESGIAIDFPDILTDLRAIPRAIPRDVVGAATAAIAVTVPLMRYLEKCGLRNCRNLGGLGNELHDLLGLLEAGSMLALITDMVSDPSGAAHEVESVLGGLARTTIDDAKSLFGVG